MKKSFYLVFCIVLLLAAACSAPDANKSIPTNIDEDLYAAVQNGGVKVIPIETAKGKFNIWTKTVGRNPKIKLLLLNGGPGATHEYFEVMESFFPQEDITFIYYDQLGTGLSDNPNDTSLWDLPRYVEEVEQVRKALNLTNDNFYLLGHSWGGIVAMEYALKYQDNLKGLIISDMMSSARDYDKYADETLAAQFEPQVLDTLRMFEKTGDTGNPRYMELLMTHFYAKHICRIPLESWPEPLNRSLSKLNQSLYVTMQGPSEFGISGKLVNWDVKQQLPNIKVPTLTIGATHDTMDPEHMKWMSTQVQNGRFLLCPEGSHMSLYDDQKHFFPGLIQFIKDVDNGAMKK
jgi:proline iminopeptidase